MEHVPGSVVPPKVVNPSMLVTWWTAQIQNAPAAHIAWLELLVSWTVSGWETKRPRFVLIGKAHGKATLFARNAGFQPAVHCHIISFH